MKRITNLKPYRYEIRLGKRKFIEPQSTIIVEDEVAAEFQKYFPTILKIEDYKDPNQKVKVKKEEPKEKKVEVKTPKKVRKVVKKIVKKVSPKKPAKTGRKKSKK